jgi:hypothetical protein
MLEMQVSLFVIQLSQQKGYIHLTPGLLRNNCLRMAEECSVSVAEAHEDKGSADLRPMDN